MPTQILNIRDPVFSPSDSIRIPKQLRGRYGSGLSVPLRIHGSKWEVASAEVKIRQSIFVILTTPLGARLMRPDFGSMLPFLVFTPVNQIFLTEARNYSLQALQKWEPRIIVDEVILDETYLDDGAVELTVVYQIKGVGTRDQVEILINLQDDPKLTESNRFTLGGRPVFGE